MRQDIRNGHGLSVNIRISSVKLVTATGGVDLLVPFQNFYPVTVDVQRKGERCPRNHEEEPVDQREADG